MRAFTELLGNLCGNNDGKINSKQLTRLREEARHWLLGTQDLANRNSSNSKTTSDLKPTWVYSATEILTKGITTVVTIDVTKDVLEDVTTDVTEDVTNFQCTSYLLIYL